MFAGHAERARRPAVAMIKFGTDGWRGVIADDFNYQNIWKVACAIVRYVKGSAEGHPPKLLI